MAVQINREELKILTGLPVGHFIKVAFDLIYLNKNADQTGDDSSK